ncbi:phage tail tip lysozyme [Nocardia sp. NPDC004722]
MAATVSLPHRPDAPILDAYISHAQAVFDALLAALGTGSARTVTIKSLETTGPAPLLSGDMASQYEANQEQVDQYRTDLGSLDVRVADIAAHSARVADTVHDEVTRLGNTIGDIIAGVPDKPPVDQQLSAVGDIDAATGEAEQAVLDAAERLSGHAGGVAAPGAAPGQGSTAPTTSTGGGFPYLGGGGLYPGGTGTPAGNHAPRGRQPINAQHITAGMRVQASDIYQYLINRYGFTPAQAAGILGNMQVESGFDTAAYNRGEGAIGLCQWEGGRRGDLERFAASQGKSVTNWQTQVDFMMSELQSGESAAYAHLRAAQTPDAAAFAFDKYYERSSGEARGLRVANAVNLAANLANVAL